MPWFELSIDQLRARPGAKWHRYADDVIPAWIAEMDFLIAEPIQAVMQNLITGAAYGYEDSSVSIALADEFAAHMRRRYGWHVAGGHVVPVADLVQAQFAAVGAFSQPGDGVLLQTPIYPPFISAVRDMGRQVVENRLVDDGTRFVVDADDLRSRIDAHTSLLLLCNPHNPTGRVFTRAELESMATIAEERDLVVLADEVHADLAYPGNVHIPFASLSPTIASRTITITSATKAYNIPGLRCGLLHFGSDALFKRFRSVYPERLLGKVNQLGIVATITAWREAAPWLGEVMQVLEQNRGRVAEFLSSQLPAVRQYSPEASYLAWLDCRELHLPAATSPASFFLEQARVGLNEGAEFGPPGEGHARLNFATSPEILDQILARMVASARAPATSVRT